MKKQRSTRGEKQAHTHKRGSVQRSFVLARSIEDSLLCLASGTSYAFATVLAVEGISYDLKSPEEQLVLNEQFQHMLAGLGYPIQILWRVLPLNLDEYLEQFGFLPEAGAEAQSIWPLISTSHATFLHHLAKRRTLLKRAIYLVVRVESGGKPQSRAQRFLTRRRRRQRWAEQREQARQELDLRIGALTRHLGDMNLSVRQLRGEQELVPFYYSCLTPEKADQFPLPSEVIASLDRPIQAPQMAHGVRALTVIEDQALAPSTRTDPPRGFTQLTDLVAPTAITLAPDCVTVEHEHTRILAVRSLPRTVYAGWLKPLADLDEPMEVSLHFQPLSSAAMVQQLRRQQRAYHSSQLLAQRKGNDADPNTKIAGGDVNDLLPRLASGEERMLEVTVLIAIRGRSKKLLDERTARVQAVLQTMLLVAHEATFEHDKAFRSCLPHGTNEMAGILLESRSASTLFPFLSNSLFHPRGILEGVTPQGDPVILDPWGEEMANANRIILGPPGWGKSHAIKTTLIRHVLKAICMQRRSQKERLSSQIIVIDPEREYAHTTTLFGGQVIRLSPGSAQHLNPFDLPRERAGAAGVEHGDRLADHVQKMHTLLEIMLANRTPTGAGQLTSDEKGLLDRALYETYRKLGISSDRKTHDRPAPLMRDLYEVLESGACGPDPSGLTQRLRRYVSGSLSGLFSGPTNVSLEKVIIDFDIKDLGAELRPVGLFLVSNFVWTESLHSQVPCLLIVDEAATIMTYESGAIFMEDLVRRGRKKYMGVSLITQHPQIFIGSAIPANCATHILMRQDVTTLDLIERMFKLSSRELQLLRRLPVGEALLLTSEKRLHVRFEASEIEHLLATTNPREIAAWREAHQNEDRARILHRLRLDESEERQETGETSAHFPSLREEQVRALLNSTPHPQEEDDATSLN